MVDYVSLHNHTHYSILDSLISPNDLFSKAKELGQKAIAVTDHGSLAGAWDALKASKSHGVKLIIGCEMYFLDDVSKKEQKFRHVVLLAKNQIGYSNLLKLNKEGFDNSAIFAKRVYPLIDWGMLEKYKEGLICLTSCANGIVSQLIMSNKREEAEKVVLKLVDIFGRDNLGLEVQSHNLKRNANLYHDAIEQATVNRNIINLAKKHNLRAIATTNAHYVNKDDAATHDVMLAIGSHQNIYSNYRIKYDVPEFYIKSGEEVRSFFERNYSEYADELCANSVFFADMCEEPNWIDPKYTNPSGKELPAFPVDEAHDFYDFKVWLQTQDNEVKELSEDKSYLRFKVYTTFEHRIVQDKIPEEKLQEYKDRILKELDVLESLDLSSYMLITADFLEYARKNGISIGPGRGSAGGSYVAYLLNIHKADSIKYGLVFERFHNKLKKAVSDIDNDISPNGMDRVIGHVINKYGTDNVACVSNLNTITPKVYARDIARACELGGSREEAVKVGNEVADSIPKEVKSIDAAFDDSPLFCEYASRYAEYERFKKIAGKIRAFSTHAAGIVIGKRPLSGLVPVRKDKDNNFAIEYDKDTAEENGLVKIDFLGLNTLDIISKTEDLIRAAGKEVPQINFEEYDQKTYDLIASGNTFGVFQFGTSAGTIDLCKKVKAKTVEELAIITTLARPASKDIREDFIKTRNGEKPISLMHPSLKRALSDTYGYPLYDESLLVLAKDVAGWDLDEADKLRKLTKEKGKNPEKARKWRQEFIDGAIKNGLDERSAVNIWEKIVEPFGKYSFNKSHAVLYSIVSYYTAYLKAHFPIEFLLANLMAEINSNAPDAESNIEKIKQELRKNKVKILPPSINSSELTYKIYSDNKLLTGLDALKFVGEDAIHDILSKRPFHSFFDFMHRVDTSKVRANTIQALAASGCLDEFKIPRKLIYLYCSDYRKKLQTWLKRHDPSKEEFAYPWPQEGSWSIEETYALEKYYLGESFICGNKHAYGEFFKQKDFVPMSMIKKADDKTNVESVRAVVRDVFEFKVKKDTSKYYGKPMIKAVIEDAVGERCSMTVFPDAWEQLKEKMKYNCGPKFKLEEGVGIHFCGTVNIYEDEIGIILKDAFGFAGQPKLPADLKHKKVNLKTSKKDSEKDKGAESQDLEDLVDDIETELYDEGLIDI